MLVSHDIRSGYGNAEILSDINVRIDAGEIVGILGPNGAGKSTFMKTITGLVNVFEGEIVYKGESISGLRPHERARLGIGYAPQQRSIFPELSVRENLKLASFANQEAFEAQLEVVYDIFPQLEALEDRSTQVLSGGERKMLALGCVVIVDPDLYLLDEPSDGLAPHLATEVFHKIQELQAGGRAILVNEQKEQILDYIDRAYILEGGTITDHGTSAELLEEGKVRESYLQ